MWLIVEYFKKLVVVVLLLLLGVVGVVLGVVGVVVVVLVVVLVADVVRCRRRSFLLLLSCLWEGRNIRRFLYYF